MRRFYPIENDTASYDIPAIDRGSSRRLWFDGVDIIEIDSLTVGGVAIPSTDYVLQPVNAGPPYRWLQIKDNATGALTPDGERYNAVEIGCTTGYSNELTPVGELTANLDATETITDIDLDPTVGVGSLLKIGAEFVVVVDKLWSSSPDSLAVDLAKQSNAGTITVATASSYCSGEIIRVGTELMRVEYHDTATGVISVKRNVGGTTLQPHTSGATIERLSDYKLSRGVCGTTAATHLGGATVSMWVIPETLRQLVTAESITTVQQTVSGYARTVGAGDNSFEAKGVGLDDIRRQARRIYKRPPTFRSL